MTAPDWALVGLLVLLVPLDTLFLWPAFLRRAEHEPERARRFLWSSWLVVLWGLAAGITALWRHASRSAAELRLVVPSGWRLGVALALVLVVAVVTFLPAIRLARSTRPIRIRHANPTAALVLPHTRAELRLYLVLSISAGLCEELVFRGYLLWAFQPPLGLWGAALLATVLFAFGHAYQGAKGIVSTGVIGGLLALVVLLTRSIYPAMLLHALADAGPGLLAGLAARGEQGASSVPG